MRLSCLASEPQDSSHLGLPSTGITRMTYQVQCLCRLWVQVLAQFDLSYCSCPSWGAYLKTVISILWCVFVWAQMWRSEKILWNLFSPSSFTWLPGTNSGHWLVCWAYMDSIEPSLFGGEMSFKRPGKLLSSSNWSWTCDSPLAPDSQPWACLVPSITPGAKADLYLDKDFGLCFQGLCIGELSSDCLVSTVPDLCDSGAGHESVALLWYRFLRKSVETEKEVKTWGT